MTILSILLLTLLVVLEVAIIVDVTLADHALKRRAAKTLGDLGTASRPSRVRRVA
jgi:hypothetical protein